MCCNLIFTSFWRREVVSESPLSVAILSCFEAVSESFVEQDEVNCRGDSGVGLVPESAKFSFPGVKLVLATLRCSNEKGMKFTSSRILSIDNRALKRLLWMSLESIPTCSGILVRRTNVIAIATIFVYLIWSPAATIFRGFDRADRSS